MPTCLNIISQLPTCSMMLSWYIFYTSSFKKNLSVTIAYSIKINILRELSVKILPSNWLKQELHIRFLLLLSFLLRKYEQNVFILGLYIYVMRIKITTMKQNPSNTVNC